MVLITLVTGAFVNQLTSLGGLTLYQSQRSFSRLLDTLFSPGMCELTRGASLSTFEQLADNAEKLWLRQEMEDATTGDPWGFTDGKNKPSMARKRM